MGILDLFKKRGDDAPHTSATSGDTDSVRKVVAALKELPPERARYVAAFAYLLGRVAYADRDFQPEEADEIVRLLQQRAHLPTEQARLVADIVKDQNELFGGTEDYLVTREFREVATRPQRLRALDCFFAVAAADDIITAEEEAAIAQMSNELGLTHEELVTARLPYSDKRSVFK
jgi:uncharacterized tellurite resistance protein B-like protein